MRTISIILFLVISFISYGQKKVEINGFILAENKTIFNPRITIEDEETLFEINSDSMGVFKAFVNSGKVKIRVELLDYEIFENQYKINGGEILTIKLKPIQRINEIVINEVRKKKLMSSDKEMLKINLSQLNELPSVTGTTDIAKILQLTPGVQNSGDINGYIYIRGGDAGHSIFRYNGVPVYGSTHLFGIFPFYNSFHIGEVQFDKANLQSQNGNFLGSSINIKQSLNKTNKVVLTGNVGFLSSQFNVKAPFQKSLLSLSFRKTYIDEFQSLISKTRKESAEKYGFNDANVTFNHNFNDKSVITLDVFHSSDVLNYESEDVFANLNQKWRNFIVSSQYDHKLSDKMKFFSKVYFSENKSDLNVSQDDLVIRVSNSIADMGIVNTLTYQTKSIKSETGILYNHFSINPYDLQLENISLLPNRFYPKTESNLYSVFQDFNIKWNDLITVKSGVRLNYFQSSDYKNISYEPKIGIFLNANKGVNYFVTLTKKVQYLNLVTTSSVGTPTDFWISTQKDVPAQKAFEFSLGSDVTLLKFHAVNASFFYNELDDLVIYPLSLSQYNETESLASDLLKGKGKGYGFEFLYKKEEGKLKGWISYTWSKSIRNFSEINDGRDFYSKYDRRHNFSTTLTYDVIPRIALGFTQIISSGNRYTSANQIYFINNTPVKEYNEYNNAQLPIYNRTDLSINYWLLKSQDKESKIALGVYNLFNIKNPVYQYVTFKENENQLSIFKKNKTFYGILPSINWYFKF